MVVDENSVVRYMADGATSDFPFTFPIDFSSDIKVEIYDTSLGGMAEPVTIDESDNYIVTPATGGFEDGGTVSIRKWNSETEEYEPFYLSSDMKVIISRQPAMVTTSEYSHNEIIPKSQLERDFDRIYFHLQNIWEHLKHVVKTSIVDGFSYGEMMLPPVESRKNKGAVFDYEGNIVAGDHTEVPVSDYMSDFLQHSSFDDLYNAGFFEKLISYEKLKDGFDSTEEGYTTDPSGLVTSLYVTNTLKTIDLMWNDLSLLTSLDHWSVERSELNSTSGFTDIATTPRYMTRYIDAPEYNYTDGFPEEKTYWYRVRGETVDGAVTSYSNTIEVIVYPVGRQDLEAHSITADNIEADTLQSLIGQFENLILDNYYGIGGASNDKQRRIYISSDMIKFIEQIYGDLTEIARITAYKDTRELNITKSIRLGSMINTLPSSAIAYYACDGGVAIGEREFGQSEVIDSDGDEYSTEMRIDHSLIIGER